MDNRDLPPWEAIDSALAADRLDVFAKLVVDATGAKINSRDHRDWNWNIGCDCHAWVLDAIHSAAEGEHHDWLHVDTSRGVLDLQFRIGGRSGVPCKFFRTDAPEQPQRTLKQSHAELAAIQQWLALDAPPAPDTVLRFAISRDDRGFVSAVTLIRLSQAEEVLYTWPVWSMDPAVLPIADAPEVEGVELDIPMVRLVDLEDDAERQLGHDEQGGA